MTTLYFDCETYSEADLKSVGTHAYAEHPSTEITVTQWAVDDGEPVVLDCTEETDGYIQAAELRMLLADPSVPIVAHNSHFDRTMLRHVWGIDVPIERWRDTMVKALAHGLPGGLEKVGTILGLQADEAKDKRGRELIQLFCKPRPKNMKLRRATRVTHPAEWVEFLEYSRQDIVAMRAIDRKLPDWNSQGRELALWHLDQTINDRGFAVDVELADKVVDLVAAERARLKQETREATSGWVDSLSKSRQLLDHILAEYGVSLPDLQADTLRRRLEDPELPDGVKLLIRLRLEDTKASTAKYKALRKAVSKDGRLRNTLQFAGALRTARWAGRIFQPQNMPRPNLQLIASHFDMTLRQLTDEWAQEYERQAIEAIKGDFAPMIFDNPMGMTANMVRGCIIAPPRHKLTIADLSNIEGRGLAFIGGEDWKVQAFAAYDKGDGPDLYNLAYSRSFNVSVDDIPPGGRQIGKVQELGLGYGGGVAAFLTFAAVYEMDLDKLAEAVWGAAPREMLERARGMWDWFKKKRLSTHGLSERTWVACETLVLSWREAHPSTCQLWSDLESAFRDAVAEPGVVFAVRDLRIRRDGAWLRVRLPSGRYLCYLSPRVDEKGCSYMGVNQYTRQWSRIRTYGGKLVENVVQGWARDVLAANMPLIDGCGYEIVLTVHDELITETPDTKDFTHEALASMMAHAPAWARGCPLSAAGFETYRYRKEV